MIYQRVICFNIPMQLLSNSIFYYYYYGNSQPDRRYVQIHTQGKHEGIWTDRVSIGAAEHMLGLHNEGFHDNSMIHI